MRRMSAFVALWQTLRGQRRPDAPPVGEQLAALPRMVVMTVRGAYPGLDRGRLLLMALAVAYVVSPVDVMPEALLLVAGLGDDAFMLTWLAGAVLAETEAFLDWEAHGSTARTPADGRAADTKRGPGGRTVPGEVV